jgi:hypothetical protein
MIGVGRAVTAARRVAALIVGQQDPNRRGSSYAITVITPIKKGRTDALRNVLQGYGRASQSPLSKLPDVQFARWVIIDQLRTDPRWAPKPRPTLKSQYLLFSADLTVPGYRTGGLPDAFFRDLAGLPAARKVWAHCLQYPGTSVDAFVAYMRKSQIAIGLYYAAYPDATGADVRHALGVRTRLTTFAREHQHAFAREHQNDIDSAALRTLYLRKSARW